MNQNLTELHVIMDKSGSMQGLKDDTIGGFNQLMSDQKDTTGKLLVGLTMFNTGVDVRFSGVPLGDVRPLRSDDYRPTGGTALLDAIGQTVTDIGSRLAKMPESERPGQVIVAIFTDGQENSSHRFTKSQIRDMVKLQTETYKWIFMFLGAGIDAFAEAPSLGIDSAWAINYNRTKSGETYKLLGQNVNAVRYSSATAQSMPTGFDEASRRKVR